VIHNITYKEMCIISEINELLGSNLDWVDELIIQEIKTIG